MMSLELEYQSRMFAGWGQRGGVQLPQRVCEALARILDDLAGQARALEGQPVPDHLRGPLPAGVVDLAAYRQARRAAADQPRGAA